MAFTSLSSSCQLWEGLILVFMALRWDFLKEKLEKCFLKCHARIFIHDGCSQVAISWFASFLQLWK